MENVFTPAQILTALNAFTMELVLHAVLDMRHTKEAVTNAQVLPNVCHVLPKIWVYATSVQVDIMLQMVLVLCVLSLIVKLVHHRAAQRLENLQA